MAGLARFIRIRSVALAALTGLSACAFAAERVDVPGRTHVIVLVDAGEATATPARRGSVELARSALTNALLGRRPIPGVPTLRKGDFLTVHHFGIDRDQLRPSGLRHAYLRTKLGHVQGISAARLSAALRPGAHYDLTSLAWARAMALADARVPSGVRVQRTFLVVLESGTKDAADVVNRHGNSKDVREVFDLRRRAADSYRFEPRLERSISASSTSARVWLRSFEVIPRSWDRQEPGGFDVRPAWTHEGNPPVATVRVQSSKSEGTISATVSAPDGKGSAGPARAGAALPIPVRFRRLPDGPVEGRIQIVIDRLVADPWLGVAQVRTVEERRVRFPAPFRVLVRAVALRAALGFLLLTALALVARLARSVWVRRKFQLRLPGHGSWMQLNADKPVQDASPHAALAKGEALRVRLPHPWLRNTWYRNATLVLSTRGGTARWDGVGGTEAPLSAFGEEAVATWDDVATYGVQAAVSIRRPGAVLAAKIEYPRLKVARPETHRTMKYHVALDLGSDSMAAYFSSDRESRMVPLQEYAPLTVTNRRPDYLRTPDGNGEMKVSPRLRSRIALSSNQPERSLSEEHAILDFWDVSHAEPMLLDGYRQSIFDFWQPELTPPLMNTTLPNPKVMFQYGVEDAFPAARTLSGEAMDLTPQDVVGHLTVQVLRNLVLRSSPLKRIDPKEIEVILTVPNVYSVEHAENLRETVERLTGVGRVSTISESDALAYYYLAERRPSVRVRDEAPRDPDAPSPITQILTIDVGRGTTDLSLIQTQQIEGEERVWVRARTGRSSGGGELTYLFVQFYEREIRRVFREHGELLAYRSEALSREQTEPPMSFLWLKNRALADADPMYGKAFYAMAELVEEVKRAFGEHYLFTTPASAQVHIQTIVDALMKFTEYAFIDVPGWKESKAEEIAAFRQHLVDALTVNAQLGTGRGSALAIGNGRSLKGEMGGWWQRTVAGMRGSRRIAVAEPPAVKALPETDRTNLDWLARQVRGYVRKNVDHLLVELASMVANQEDREAFARAESMEERVEIALRALVEPGRTHVVVGGQASQFGPLKRAIYARFKPMQGEELAALTMLVGQDAKDACCQGAVIYATSGHNPQNRDALHGSYGFVDVARTEGAAVYPIDIRRLNDEGEDRVKTPSDVARYLVFTPGTFGGSGEEVDEAMLSRLGRFRGREYCVTYRREEGDSIRRLRVDGEEVRLSTFGDLKDNVWKKVWPDQLPREPQS